MSHNPAAIHLLEANQDKIYWPGLTINPAIIELDYAAIRSTIAPLKEELVAYVLHPCRVKRIMDLFNYCILEDCFEEDIYDDLV